MNLEKQAKIIDSIHDTLAELVGERLNVRENLGRSKIVESTGTITQVHPRLFIMEVERKRGRTARKSFQYADILTGMVKLSKDGEPIFGQFVTDDEEDDVISEIENILQEDIEEERVLL